MTVILESPKLCQCRLTSQSQSLSILAVAVPIKKSLLDLFCTKAKLRSKKIRNLSQNAGKDHFRDTNVQTFLVEHAPRPR